MIHDNIYFSEKNYVKKQIQDLIPGDILLHPIYRSDGLMLINQNKNLDAYLISIIKKHIAPTDCILVCTSAKSFEKFLQDNNYIDSEFKEDLGKIMNKYHSAAGNQNGNYILNENIVNFSTANPVANLLSNSPYWNFFENRLESEHLRKRACLVKSELITLFTNDHTFISLFDRIKNYNDVLLIHSINTTCISLMFGLTLELTLENLLDLAVAALFINVGFTELPKEEFKSFLRTQKYSHPAMKKHLELFSSMTSDSPLLRKKSIVHGILDHHEAYNGSGYPSGKKGEEISLFGRILHISHTYDGLVGGYDYTTGITPSEAFGFICENKESMFDQNVINIFLHRTTYYKLGEKILLSNGLTGEIIDFENYIKNPYFPIVRLEDDTIINLLKENE